MKTRLRISRRVEVLGHLDRVRLQNADALGVRAPHRQRADAVSHAQPRAARAELLDDADELVAGRERRLRHAEIRADAEHGIGVRHAGRQNPDAHLARTRSRILVLHDPQDLGTAEVIDDDALHAARHIPAGPSRHPMKPRTFDPYKTAGSPTVVVFDPLRDAGRRRLLVYILLGRYFIGGLMAGSVKG